MKLYKHISCTLQDRVAYITLKSPTLNDVLIIELMDALMSMQEDPGTKVIVIKAEDGADFCTGVDIEYLKRMQRYNMQQNHADANNLAQLFLTIYRSTKVVIAEVQGAAVAAGCGLITVCDFVFASSDAVFGFDEVKNGTVPAISMAFILRKIGETRGKELMLSGKIIDAIKAVRYDLVTDIFPANDLSKYVNDFASNLCKEASAASLQLTKKMIADIQAFPLENAMQFAAKMNAYARATDDRKRAIDAKINEEEITW